MEKNRFGHRAPAPRSRLTPGQVIATLAVVVLVGTILLLREFAFGALPAWVAESVLPTAADTTHLEPLATPKGTIPARAVGEQIELTAALATSVLTADNAVATGCYQFAAALAQLDLTRVNVKIAAAAGDEQATLEVFNMPCDAQIPATSTARYVANRVLRLLTDFDSTNSWGWADVDGYGLAVDSARGRGLKWKLTYDNAASTTAAAQADVLFGLRVVAK